MTLAQSLCLQHLRSRSKSFFHGSARLNSGLKCFKKTPAPLDKKANQARPDLKANQAKTVNQDRKATPDLKANQAQKATSGRKVNPAKTALADRKAQKAKPGLRVHVALRQRTVGAGQNSRSSDQTASGVTKLISVVRQAAGAALSACHSLVQPPNLLPQNGSPTWGMPYLKSGFTRTRVQRSYPSAGYLVMTAAARWTRSHSLTALVRKPASGHLPTVAGFCPV